jgi:hypothetical protein
MLFVGSVNGISGQLSVLEQYSESWCLNADLKYKYLFTVWRVIYNQSNAMFLYHEIGTPFVALLQEEFEVTKWIIRIHKSKKNKQHYDQKKKDKRTNNHLQNIQIKLKIE